MHGFNYFKEIITFDPEKVKMYCKSNAEGKNVL
jgi:hypothetical protein